MIYEARHARGTSYGLMGACILLSVMGFAVAGIIPTKSGSYPLLGWAIVAACFAAAFIFYRRAADRTPQARVDEHGVYARRFSAETVPWDRIAGAHTIRSGIQRIIRFELQDPANPTATPRKFGINTTFYDCGMAELVAAVRHYRPDLGV